MDELRTILADLARLIAKALPKHPEARDIVRRLEELDERESSARKFGLTKHGEINLTVEYWDGSVKSFKSWEELAQLFSISPNSIRAQMSSAGNCMVKTLRDLSATKRKVRITRVGFAREDHPALREPLTGSPTKPGPKKIDYSQDDRIYGSAGPDVFVPRSARVKPAPVETPKPRGRR